MIVLQNLCFIYVCCIPEKRKPKLKPTKQTEQTEQTEDLYSVLSQEPKALDKCPEDWTRFKDGRLCLKAFPSKKTNDGARRTCQKNGGDLVTVDSSAKNDFVRSKALILPF